MELECIVYSFFLKLFDYLCVFSQYVIPCFTCAFLQGLYRGAKNNEMRLGCCSRTNDVVEPMIKPQWYVNCSSMAKQALDAAIDGENPKLEFFPKQYLAEWKRFSYFIYLHITYKMKLDA